MTLDSNLHLPHEHDNYVLSNNDNHDMQQILPYLFCLFRFFFFSVKCSASRCKGQTSCLPFPVRSHLTSLLLLSHYFLLGPPPSPFSQSLLSAPVRKFAYLYSWKEGARERERIMTAISSLSPLAGLRESVV